MSIRQGASRGEDLMRGRADVQMRSRAEDVSQRTVD